MMRTFLIVCSIGLIYTDTCSQWNFIVEPELGLNASGIPFRDKAFIGNDEITEQELPVVSPIAGAYVSMIKGNYLLRLGIQYSNCGYKYMIDRRTTINQTINNYHIEEVLMFNRVSIPFLVGYKMPFRKVHMVVFGGYKVIHYTSGMYTYYSEFNDVITESKEIDPFNYGNLEPGAKKNSWHYLVGVEVEIFKGLFGSIGFSHGGKIYFSESTPPGGTDPFLYHEYSNGDISLSIRYQISFQRDSLNPTLTD